MTISIPDRLCSRKLWVTILAVGIVMGPSYGLDVQGTVQQIISATMPAYMLMQGLQDALAGKAPAQITTTILPPKE